MHPNPGAGASAPSPTARSPAHARAQGSHSNPSAAVASATPPSAKPQPPSSGPGAPPKRAAAPPARGGRSYAIVAVGLGLAATGVLVALAVYGWDYYTRPLIERVRHPLHRALRPSGSIGGKLALAGTALMLLNLLYSARRRLAGMQRGFGSQRLWLEVHVFCGLLGPALLCFHAAFLARNLVAQVTAASTFIVVLAGVGGRYLYGQIPRNVHGKVLALADLQGIQRALVLEAVGDLDASDHLRAEILACAAPEPPKKVTGPQLVWASLRRDLGWLARWVRLRRALRAAGVTRARRREILAATRRLLVIGLQATHLVSFQRVLARWRVVHFALALVMIACMVVHIGIVTALGYGVW